MTVTELRERKIKLEQDIFNLIKEFQEETKVGFNNIDVDVIKTIINTMDGDYTTSRIEVNIDLDI